MRVIQYQPATKFVYFVCTVQPSSHRDDVIAFISGDSADYKRSDAVAEMAIKWAQERREKIEVSRIVLMIV